MDDDDRMGADDGGSRPVPDPTVLTDKAIAKLERSLTQYIDGQLQVRDQRLDGQETVAGLNRAAITAEVLHLRELIDERFRGVATQFAERDQANGKAIDKSERATADAITTNLELTRATTDALAKGLDEVKGRVTVIESTKLGQVEQRQQATDSRMAIYAAIGVVGTVVGLIIGVLAFLAAQARAA